MWKKEAFLKKKENQIFKKSNENNSSEKHTNFSFSLVMVLGLLTGITSGFVGAGGGFLNIPVLVFFVRLPMKKAIGTSLFIIAVKSLIGFLGDVDHIVIDWKFLFIFTTLSILGVLIGILISKYIEGKKLKKGFGYFTLIMGGYIILKELF